ncbi:UBA domain-containing protein 7 [Escovopsis weberi]|uniref:UBA domain-containing protein 7 n=1 Tax=Escovopsis weberi TaxID=150374 RepID=A0A0M8MZZ6_ESCWE|nr:UBA domain-containing protein 7 [Escovopsis weberi]
MDDLSGLDWSSNPPTGQPKPPVLNPFSSFRNTPAASSPGTPLSAQGTSSSQSKAAQPKPQHDSFSNLMNFGLPKPAQNLTLAERQAQLEAEKRRKLEESRRQAEAQFGSGSHWDALGSRGFTPSPAPPPQQQQGQAAPGVSKHRHDDDDDDDDLFAAFNRDTKVDNASHYPPPPPEKKGLDLSDPSAWSSATSTAASSTSVTAAAQSANRFFEADGNHDEGGGGGDDDDPFGLNTLNDFDFLGDLARPVDEVRREQEAKQQAARQAFQRPSRLEPGKPIEDDSSSSSSSSDDEEPVNVDTRQRPPRPSDDPFDQAVAQLVDYGFSPEQARRGLVESGSGFNAQVAANWLLDEAHRKAKDKAQGRTSASSAGTSQREGSSPAPDFTSARGEVDLAKQAAAMGNSLFKSANSLWKTGQKKMQQAVAEFQQDGDPGQPRWMREAQQTRAQSQPRPQLRSQQQPVADVTDEAMMLESGQRPQPSMRSGAQHQQHQEKPLPPRPSRADRRDLRESRGSSPAPSSRSSPAPRWQQQPQPPPAFSDARSRLDKLKIDDDDSFSISTSNRRRKASPASESVNLKAEPDLLFSTQAPKPPSSAPPQQSLRQSPAPTSRPQLPAAPAPRKAATPRPAQQAPALSSDALQKSTSHRHQGTAHFKRGDYAAAHASYTAATSSIPPSHPLMIVLLTNRALTALKTGEPREAVTHADEALRIIGPGNGQGETVAVRSENGQDEQRDMKDLYGKALSRKAEALEQMEKWADAGAVWQLCVEAGAGGATAIKGRQRCQEALAPKPKAAPKLRPAAAKPRPNTNPFLREAAPAQSSEAVTRLREANEAAAKEDDEKFALADKVDARVAAWRDGKRENLRALIASLDNVLWQNSGWKTVGLHELLQANKVKISYMKAIAKTHPDKLPQDASTEVKLIAGMVFSTLNESWDKFKADNGL